jgi:hypothetical protein
LKVFKFWQRGVLDVKKTMLRGCTVMACGALFKSNTYMAYMCLGVW